MQDGACEWQKVFLDRELKPLTYLCQCLWSICLLPCWRALEKCCKPLGLHCIWERGGKAGGLGESPRTTPVAEEKHRCRMRALAPRDKVTHSPQQPNKHSLSLSWQMLEATDWKSEFLGSGKKQNIGQGKNPLKLRTSWFGHRVTSRAPESPPPGYCSLLKRRKVMGGFYTMDSIERNSEGVCSNRNSSLPLKESKIFPPGEHRKDCFF